MLNLTQGGISFTVNNTEILGGFATKRINSTVITDKKYNVNRKQSLIDRNNEQNGGFSVNAVDIDWNNGELPNADTTTGGTKNIKNSGELLKLIDDIQKEIYVLTDIIFNKLSNNYYWYAGVVYPSDPNSSAQNNTFNKWTKLISTPASIHVETEWYDDSVTWYVAIPHSYNFVSWDSDGSSEEPNAYNKSENTLTINGINYDLFTTTGLRNAINAVFKASRS